jgi:hypothetical protein
VVIIMVKLWFKQNKKISSEQDKRQLNLSCSLFLLAKLVATSYN